MARRELGELAVELTGLKDVVTTLGLAVRHSLDGQEAPSDKVIDSAFYSVEATLERIAEDLEALEIEQIRNNGTGNEQVA